MTTPSHPPHTGPETIARALIVEGGSLLVCRNTEQGYAYLPGGHIEVGESAEEALARELDEEAGLSCTIRRPLLLTEVVFGDPPKRGGHELNLVFHVERTGAEPVQSREPGIGFEWVDLAAVVDLDLRPRAIKAWIVGGASPESRLEHVFDREAD